MFVFATCDRHRALGFLQKLYPNSLITGEEPKVKALLDEVEKDFIRIPDPAMHGNRGEITAGKNWVEDDTERARIVKICNEFHDWAT